MLGKSLRETVISIPFISRDTFPKMYGQMIDTFLPAVQRRATKTTAACESSQVFSPARQVRYCLQAMSYAEMLY